MQIRPATEQDLETIVDFNLKLAAETEDKPLDRNTVTQGVRALLTSEGRGRYFVAEVEGRVVGQVMHTYEWSDWRNGNVWWLQSVYVLQEFRGQGIFKRLYQHILNAAEAEPGVVGIRLYVENENATAQAAYRRLGLTGESYRVMETIFST